MKRTLPVILFGAGFAGLLDARAQSSQLSVYNLIVRNTLYQANHTYGRVITQNIDLTAANQTVEIGSRLGGSNSDGITPLPSQSTASLLVGGNISANSGDTIRLINGSAFLDNSSTTAPAGRISLQQSGNGASIVRASPAGSAQAATFDSVFSAVVSESATYSSRATSASTTWSTSGNRTTFTIPSSTSVRQVVFNLTETEAQSIFVDNSNAEVQFDLNSRLVSSIDSIVINIAGFTAGAFTNNANFLGTITSDLSFRQRVLWNFYQSDENIQLDRNWYGSILAPTANLTGGSNLDGSAAVNNITFNAEIHGPLWSGVPETSTYAAVTFVLAAAGWTAWRRRNPRARS